MITSYYDPKYLKCTKEQLEKECKRIFEQELKVREEETRYLAKATQLQSQSSFWWEYKKGLLTSSRFLAISRTSIFKPAKSLVSEILFHKQLTSKVPALSWGITNEEKARSSYNNISLHKHSDFVLSCTGLHINPRFPHLGASPDGLISCSCCGNGVLEIKCPYSVCKGIPTVVAYLVDGKLSCKHAYYYQVQGQMGILERSYCDFVVWTPRDTFIERTLFNQCFFDTMKKKLDSFFVSVILPKVLTNNHEDRGSSHHPSEADGIFCYCRRGEFQDMVLCDNPSCKIGWFHFSCINMKEEPKGTWFCPDCSV